MKLPHTFLVACLGASSLCAQQVEQKTEAPKPATTGNAIGGAKTAPRNSPAPSGQHHSHDNARPQPEQKPVTYLGVLTREVPEELRAQFSLAEGFGLLIAEVMPDSPAKAAGLKKHDVLVKFEDQQIVNIEQFMALVRAKQKGAVVQLDVIIGGKETKLPVTLGEHMIAVTDHHPHQEYSGWPQPNGRHFFNGDTFRGGEQRGFQHQNHELHEHLERFQQEMREYQQRMQEWSKNPGSGTPMPQPPKLDLPGGHPSRGERHRTASQPQTGISIPPSASVQQFNFSQSHAAANVTRRDDSGEYSLKNDDGKTTFIARPHNGHEQSWPVNTDAERQAVPQEFRDTLRLMDGASGGIRIEVNPGPGRNTPDTPAPRGGASAPAPPPVKGRPTSA